MKDHFLQNGGAPGKPHGQVYCEVRSGWGDNIRNVMEFEEVEKLRRRFESNLSAWLSGALEQDEMFEAWNRFEDDITQIQIPGRSGPDQSFVEQCDQLFANLRESKRRSDAFLRANNVMDAGPPLPGGDDSGALRRYLFCELLHRPHAEARLPIPFQSNDLG